MSIQAWHIFSSHVIVHNDCLCDRNIEKKNEKKGKKGKNREKQRKATTNGIDETHSRAQNNTPRDIQFSIDILVHYSLHFYYYDCLFAQHCHRHCHCKRQHPPIELVYALDFRSSSSPPSYDPTHGVCLCVRVYVCVYPVPTESRVPIRWKINGDKTIHHTTTYRQLHMTSYSTLSQHFCWFCIFLFRFFNCWWLFTADGDYYQTYTESVYSIGDVLMCVPPTLIVCNFIWAMSATIFFVLIYLWLLLHFELVRPYPSFIVHDSHQIYHKSLYKFVVGKKLPKQK